MTAGLMCAPDATDDDDTGEDREAPAEVDHQEAAAVALGLRQGDVGDHAATEQHQHRRADHLRYEYDAQIHVPSSPLSNEKPAAPRNSSHDTQLSIVWEWARRIPVDCAL